MVGETGFEPATPASQTRCATRLRHSPWSHCDILTDGAVVVQRFGYLFLAATTPLTLLSTKQTTAHRLIAAMVTTA